MLKNKKNQFALILFLTVLFIIILGTNDKVSAVNKVIRTYFAYPGSTIKIQTNDNSIDNYVFEQAEIKTDKNGNQTGIAKDWKYDCNTGNVTVPDNATVNKSYFVITWKKTDTYWTEIRVMPKYMIKINNNEEPKITEGTNLNIKIYSDSNEQTISALVYKDKILESHKIYVQEKTNDENGSKPKTYKKKTIIDRKQTSEISFASNMPNVVTVDRKTGKIIAKEPGTATITMTRKIKDIHYISEKHTSYTATSTLTATIKIVVEAKNFKIKYESNGGKGVPEEATFNSTDKQITISNTKPTKSSYKFLGWSTDNKSTKAEYLPGKKITNPKKDITLYAVWQKENNNKPISSGDIYTGKLKVGNKLQIKSGNAWWTYTKHTGKNLNSGVKYRALLGNDKVEIKEIDGNWLKVKIISLSNKTSKNNFKVGSYYYIYYGSTACKYITTIK